MLLGAITFMDSPAVSNPRGRETRRPKAAEDGAGGVNGGQLGLTRVADEALRAVEDKEREGGSVFHLVGGDPHPVAPPHGDAAIARAEVDADT